MDQLGHHSNRRRGLAPASGCDFSDWRRPLVFIDSIEPARVPAFEEVEPDVKSAWLDDRQAELKRKAFEAIRARYTVVVPPMNAADFQNLQIPQNDLPPAALVPQ
jgi:peptidyl-prolyl cis-trans isomerase C